ncbi:MAG: S8 family peptidase [Methylocella sp.]
MGGLVLHGDLFFSLQSGDIRPLAHWLESVKILPPGGFPANKPANYGDVTYGAVAKIEIEDAHRARAHCLAITDEFFDPSRPSSWSGAIDQACAGSLPGDDDDRSRRLFLIASGNTVDNGKIDQVLALRALEDPAQSWNAITIGGYTAKENIYPTGSELRPAVKANNRSPYGRGSVGFDRSLMPIKPEVVFEAGNMAVNASNDCISHDSLSLISTGSSPLTKPLVPFWATSAATAMAGNFLGRLMAALPGRWKETYRGLMVHSAEWTVPMRERMRAFSNRRVNHPLLREFGFGVPNIDRALWSTRNEVTLMAEAEIQPFALSSDGTRAVFNEIHYYRLPWPQAVLQRLENELVNLRITLSYLPDPNLSPRAATRPETYRSFGLRFKLKRKDETENDFRQRVNKSERESGASFGTDSQANNWLVGVGAISAGSLHCDIWRGRATDLASMDVIAVHPVIGWWKTHVGQQKAESAGRYALFVSLDARGHDVDLYTEITNSLSAGVPIAV